MVNGFIRLATSEVWLDWDMVRLSVDLGEILIENLGVSRNYGTDNV